MKIIGFGPYIGDFEQEVITFRPFIRWITRALKPDLIFLNTHFNRSFLYEWVRSENIFPIYEHLSRDELGQFGYTHDQFKQKDHNLLAKIFKEKIANICKCSKRDIEIYNINYARNKPVYSVYQKIFTPIQVPDINIKEEYLNRVIYIPAPGYHLEEIYEYMVSKYNAIVVGDLRLTGYCSENNVMLKFIDYFENGFKYIMKILETAKAIICPTSYWTFLANLQGYPVFSYGDYPGLYKNDGIYSFSNNNSVVIPADEDSSIDGIYSMIDYFVENYGKSN